MLYLNKVELRLVVVVGKLDDRIAIEGERTGTGSHEDRE